MLQDVVHPPQPHLPIVRQCFTLHFPHSFLNVSCISSLSSHHSSALLLVSVFSFRWVGAYFLSFLPNLSGAGFMVSHSFFSLQICPCALILFVFEFLSVFLNVFTCLQYALFSRAVFLFLKNLFPFFAQYLFLVSYVRSSSNSSSSLLLIIMVCVIHISFRMDVNTKMSFSKGHYHPLL